MKKGINLFKFIFALIIALYCIQFSGFFGAILSLFSRIGVIFFFLVSGYFSFKNGIYLDDKAIFKRIRKLVFVFLLFSVIGILQDIYNCLINHYDFSKFFSNEFSLTRIIQFFVFNVPFSSGIGTFWFVLAMIYVYVIFYYVKKFHLVKLTYVLAPVVLSIATITLLSFNIFNIKYGSYFYLFRNFLLEATPCFFIGLYISEKNIQPTRMCFVFLIFGVLLGMCESIFVGDLDLYLGAIISAIAIFTLSLRYFDSDIGNWLGMNYSMPIYYSHKLIIEFILILNFANKWANYQYWNIVYVISSVFIIFFVSSVYVIVSRRLKKERKKTNV